MLASRSITYSPAYTLVPTYECFNRCTYCNFRADPHQSPWLSLEQARTQLQRLQGIVEILILSGEVHPHSPRRAEWLERIYQLCRLALEMGFLPHTNVGPLSRAEMSRLKPVNVSMGLMVEQVTPSLLATVHRQAPSKHPALRLQQLAWAGELQIPFTTGLLVGIGETEADWQDTLGAIAALHERWGHIQEVILQPYCLGSRQSGQQFSFAAPAMVKLVGIARELLPADITLQIPPNLVQEPEVLLACLSAGARDLGGLVPRDEVNPDYHHPSIATLEALLYSSGWQLVPRLPIYPQYDAWLPDHLRYRVRVQRQQLRSQTSA